MNDSRTTEWNKERESNLRVDSWSKRTQNLTEAERSEKEKETNDFDYKDGHFFGTLVALIHYLSSVSLWEKKTTGDKSTTVQCVSKRPLAGGADESLLVTTM